MSALNLDLGSFGPTPQRQHRLRRQRVPYEVNGANKNRATCQCERKAPYPRLPDQVNVARGRIDNIERGSAPRVHARIAITI